MKLAVGHLLYWPTSRKRSLARHNDYPNHMRIDEQCNLVLLHVPVTLIYISIHLQNHTGLISSMLLHR